MNAYPVISRDPGIQAHYEACRQRGTSHALAEMFALGKPPKSQTDREFLLGHCNGNQFADTPHLGEAYARHAREDGVDITGKVYLSSLADYPGDPKAWVSGRGDVKRVCEERGWGCDGMVKVQRRPQEYERGPYRVADDIVADRAEDLLLAGEAKTTEEAMHTARDQLSPMATG